VLSDVTGEVLEAEGLPVGKGICNHDGLHQLPLPHEIEGRAHGARDEQVPQVLDLTAAPDAPRPPRAGEAVPRGASRSRELDGHDLTRRWVPQAVEPGRGPAGEDVVRSCQSSRIDAHLRGRLDVAMDVHVLQQTYPRSAAQLISGQ
jgi:hypothetical protein